MSKIDEIIHKAKELKSLMEELMLYLALDKYINTVE